VDEHFDTLKQRTRTRVLAMRDELASALSASTGVTDVPHRRSSSSSSANNNGGGGGDDNDDEYAALSPSVLASIPIWIRASVGGDTTALEHYAVIFNPASSREQRQVALAEQTVATVFKCFVVWESYGRVFSPVQMMQVRHMVGSVLPQLCGPGHEGMRIYELLRAKFKILYGIEYVSKGNSLTLARRVGKSFVSAHVMAALCIAAPRIQVAFINLFSAAGNQNLEYMLEAIKIIEDDKRIRCEFIKVHKQYYIHIKSHMQYVLTEANGSSERKIKVCDMILPAEYNLACSLPNMDSGAGKVRVACGFFFFSCVFCIVELRVCVCVCACTCARDGVGQSVRTFAHTPRLRCVCVYMIKHRTRTHAQP
jgi:hypothetical protein